MPVRVGLQYIDIWKSSMEDAIAEYEKEQQEKGQIVFYGPSNFTRWSTTFGMVPMREVLLGKSGKECVVNRGFGSSCSEHQLYYYPRAVRPLEPKVLVYSGFGNGGAFGYSVEEIWELAQRVVVYAMTDFPDITIYLCGVNVSRETTPEKMEKKRKYDSLLEEFASKNPNCHYLNFLDYEPLASRKDIYVEDGIHFNQEGYHLYGEYFKKALEEELAKY